MSRTKLNKNKITLNREAQGKIKQLMKTQ